MIYIYIYTHLHILVHAHVHKKECDIDIGVYMSAHTHVCIYKYTHTHLLNSDFILHTCCICFFWTSPATLDIGIHVPGSGTPPPPINHFWGRVYTMHDTLHVHDMFTLIHISHCATPWLTTCLHTAAKRCSLPQG